MPIKIHFNSRLALGISLFFAAAGLAFASPVSFPIKELGNCANTAECKAFCDEAGNQSVCERFATAHQLLPQDSQAGKITAALAEDGGPGGCARGSTDPAGSCRIFCSASNHIEACVTYGRDHQLFSEKSLANAEKIAQALKSGVALPQGCISEQMCAEVCEYPTNLGSAQACFQFAKNAGLLPSSIDPQKVQDMFTALLSSNSIFKTPADIAQCEHPASAHILQACLALRVQAGLLTQDEADAIQKIGGVGPNDCRDEGNCKAYCADHQSECLQFAETHGLVSPGVPAKQAHASAELRANLSEAPGSVLNCLNAQVGTDTVSQIMSGAALPDADIGDHMLTCFNQFLEAEQATSSAQNSGSNTATSSQTAPVGQNPPTSATSSTQDSTTESTSSADTSTPAANMPFTPSPASTTEDTSATNAGDQTPGVDIPIRPKLQFLLEAPDEVISCLRSDLGDSLDELVKGEIDLTPDLNDAIANCFDAYQIYQSIPVYQPANN